MNIENKLPGGVMLSGWAHFLFTAVTNALLFGLIYKVLPKVTVRWRDALAGGLLVSLVWILGQHLLVTFLIGPSYTAYGIVGSFIAVMIWVYYVSVILFLGAEFVEALSIVGGPKQKAGEADNASAPRTRETPPFSLSCTPPHQWIHRHRQTFPCAVFA